MQRRIFLAALGAAGTVGTAGCGTIRSETSLSDPTVHTYSSGRRSLSFTADGEEVGSLGVTGEAVSDRIDLQTEIWHRQETNVESITLHVWMPSTETGSAADVAVVSPVEGDSSPPPSLALFSPQQGHGTIIKVTDLDDLADETISTLDLIVRPRSETATTVKIDTTIELTTSGLRGTDYILDGQLQLDFPGLTRQ